MPVWPQSVSNLPKMGKICDFIRSDFSTFWCALGTFWRQNVPKSDLIKSRIFPILGKFDALWGQTGNRALRLLFMLIFQGLTLSPCSHYSVINILAGLYTEWPLQYFLGIFLFKTFFLFFSWYSLFFISFSWYLYWNLYIII